MEFQTTLPYAVDSNLHVIKGLDLSGTPIFQRPGDWRFKAVDMYTLLQGIIERCLATQQPDGSYLVSPTIFDETMFSTDSHISYASISRWTERDYPGGVLNEVSGYVKNLMDNYPQSLLLLAIDDKLWALGSCSSGVHVPESCYGTLMDTAPFFNPFWDITFAMTAAGVGFDPTSFEMQVVPARITGGSPIYGSPEGSTRIYPELLIDRYKVMQQLRYKKTAIYDTRRSTGTASGSASYANPNPPYYYWPPYYYPTLADAQAVNNLAAQNFKDLYAVTLGSVDNLGAMTPSGLTAWWTLSAMLWIAFGYSGPFSRYLANAVVEGHPGKAGPNFKIKGYDSISHKVQMWAWWDGTGNPRMGFSTVAGGSPIVAGKNLIWEVDNPTGETQYSPDVNWNSAAWPPDNIINNPYTSSPSSWDDGASIVASPPIEDWQFQFCRHNDFGGAVTWIP